MVLGVYLLLQSQRLLQSVFDSSLNKFVSSL